MKLREALELWDKPPFNRQVGIHEIMDAANLVRDMPTKTLIVAGLLSTIEFQPSLSHPIHMELMAKRVIEILMNPDETK